MTSKKRVTHKQLNLYVYPEIHKIIKIRAAEYNVSMELYILQAIKMRIENEDRINNQSTEWKI